MKKAIRILTGVVLILVGLVLSLPGVPGPGTPIAVAGLVILADHFAWARRLVDWGKAKLHIWQERYRARRAARRPDRAE